MKRSAQARSIVSDDSSLIKRRRLRGIAFCDLGGGSSLLYARKRLVSLMNFDPWSSRVGLGLPA